MNAVIARVVALLLLCGLSGLSPSRAQETTRSGDPAVVAGGEDAGVESAPRYPPLKVPAVVNAVQLVFAIDCSGSMKDMMPRAKEAMVALVRENLLAHPNAEYHYGIVLYGDGERTYLAKGFFGENDFNHVLKRVTAVPSAQTEYVGAFLEKALSLKWSDKPDVLKRIYVLGNESAAQDRDQKHYTQILQKTRARGILVSGVFCSSPKRPVIAQGELGDAREYVRQELEDKRSWVDLSERGGSGLFYQIAYGPGDIVAFAWEPKQFREQAELMESDGYLSQVIQEQQYYRQQVHITRQNQREVMAHLYVRREQNVANWLTENGVRALRLYPPVPDAAARTTAR